MIDWAYILYMVVCYLMRKQEVLVTGEREMHKDSMAYS